MPSKYKPQRPSWREDLYKGIYSVHQRLSNNKKLCYQDDNYCELSRQDGAMGFFSRFLIRIMFFLGTLTSVLGICVSIIAVIAIIYIEPDHQDYEVLTILFLLLLFFSVIIGYFFFIFFLLSIFAPMDCPIRFNRQTQKVYIYEYPLLYVSFTTAFKVAIKNLKKDLIKEFDWSDIQAVMTSVSMPLSSGGMVRNYRIECVVCKPGTNQIVDHFLLSTDSSLCYDEWMWINSYMAFSDKNLDKTITLPESLWARKVFWPTDIDRKSKATSLEEYEKITASYS